MNIKALVGILFIGIVLNIFLLYFLFFRLNSSVEELLTKQSVQISPIVSQSSQTITGESSASGNTCTACTNEIEVLQVEVNKLKSASSGSDSVSSSSQSSNTQEQSIKEVTIPFGSGDGQSNDWKDVPGLASYINTNNYSKIQSAKFEATLSIPTANGWVYARLYNKTKNQPVWGSDMYSETDQSIYKKSQELSLAEGENLYQVQLKNTLSARSLITGAKIKLILE